MRNQGTQLEARILGSREQDGIGPRVGKYARRFGIDLGHLVVGQRGQGARQLGGVGVRQRDTSTSASDTVSMRE